MKTPHWLLPLVLAAFWTGAPLLRAESDTTQEIADRYEQLLVRSPQGGASFDRVVAETSKLTESLVKLAGEAFQPLSNRASANAERFNTLVA